MGAREFDLVVIGAGSGGLASAKRAASYGARVAIVEQDRVGGTCVIRGCVPKKLMVYAAEFAETFELAGGYGWKVGPRELDWAALVEARHRAVARLEETHERLLREAGVELLRGHARLSGTHEVVVGERVLAARHVIIATGALPVLPSIPGVQHAMTSDAMFELDMQPRRVAIVGSGYIAVEFASILSGLGTEVTMLIRRDLPLTGFDIDIQTELLRALRERGVDVCTGTVVERVSREPDGHHVVQANGPDGSYTIESDKVLLFAIGRSPNTAGLGLEEAGVALGPNGEVITDDFQATSVPDIFAIGDVTDRAPLTPVAIQAGRLLADRVFGGKPGVMSYDDIPTAVFSIPPIGTVGLTEQEAVARLGADRIRIFKSRFHPLLYSLSDHKVPTLVKLIVRKSDDRVVGCHLIGHDAAEIVQGFAVAMKAGATKAVFDATVGIHPSSAEELVTLT